MIQAVVNQALEGQTGQLGEQANRLQASIIGLCVISIVLAIMNVFAPTAMQIAWNQWGRATAVRLTPPTIRVDTTQPFRCPSKLRYPRIVPPLQNCQCLLTRCRL